MIEWGLRKKGKKMNKCPACEEVAEMKRYGWNDYFCRKHDEPIVRNSK